VGYFLLYKYDRKEDQKIRKLPFSTDAEAVVHACTIIAGNGGWNFEVQNDRGEVVIDDDEIRSRCKQTRLP
jgi:hypothetical protein